MRKRTPDEPATRSADMVAGNLERLAALFPEAFTDGRVDFAVLKQLLGGAVDECEEKYGLSWHGKQAARQLALTPSTGTLRPSPEESVDWESTQNLMIEGDNLEVLKLLQKSYAGKVKLIYIDPPYNTGKDFVYSDNFQDNRKQYLERTGQTEGGRKSSSDSESSGRFHTAWLNMIYPRLQLAKTLLRDDGLLFVSIDDHEIDNLRKVLAEIFGEQNFIAQFVWNTAGHTDNQFDVKVNHEYVVLYARDAAAAAIGHVIDPNTRQESNLWKGFAENSITKNGPANPPSEVLLPAGFPCTARQIDLPASGLPDRFFTAVRTHGYISREITAAYGVAYPVRLDPMQVAGGRLQAPCRVFSGWANANKLRAFIRNGCRPIADGGDQISFSLSEKGVIYYRRDRAQARHILSVLRNLGTTERMRSELEGLGIPFSYPKPKELLKYLIRIGAEDGGIVLDFFAGSGTTAHAAWELGVEENIARRVIAVQLPEPFDPQDERQRPAVAFCDQLGKPRNLAELTKERLRRTGRKIREENPRYGGDLGFRVFKLDSSNIGKAGCTEADILYELALKLDLDLCVPIEQRHMAGKAVHSMGGGVLFACLAETITREEAAPLAESIAAWHQELAPSVETTCVFRDSAFADDVARLQLTFLLEEHGIHATLVGLR